MVTQMERLKPRWNISYLTDIDRDGVPNYKDCKPFNRNQQHIRPSKTTLERLRNLPIFFASGKLARYDRATKQRILGDEWNKQILKIYHLTYKNMPANAYLAKKRFLGIIKKRPEIVGWIERKKPHRIIFVTKRGSWKGVTLQAFGITIPKTAVMSERISVAFVYLGTTGKGLRYSLHYATKRCPFTIIHELVHVGQIRFSTHGFVQSMMPLMEVDADKEALKAERLRFKEKQLHPSGYRKILKLR